MGVFVVTPKRRKALYGCSADGCSDAVLQHVPSAFRLVFPDGGSRSFGRILFMTVRVASLLKLLSEQRRVGGPGVVVV